MSAGQIHDLGYKRYVGSRRSMGTRWTVIMRHQLATAWKTWWRFKVWLIAAMLATAVSGGVLYFLSGRMFRMLGGLSGQGINFADGILPLSMQWYCPIGFIISLAIGATVVAGDVQSGAFTFYFARSVRPRDYVIGKLAGLGILLSLVMVGGPLFLSGLRLGLSDDLDHLIELAPVVYKALAIGALGTLVYAAVPLGFSALITNRRYAMALWAAYYLMIGWMAQGISFVTRPELAALDLGAALKGVAMNLFEVQMSGRNAMIPTSAALISIVGHAAIAIGLVFWRVRNAQQTGVGGSS
jgi:ABC-type transport system involved in multi-copper enzyme maturation permease subunit